MNQIPVWTTQYAVKTNRDGMPEEVAVQIYHVWPNGLTDELTYHSHLREFGLKQEHEHYHISLKVLSKLDMLTYDLITTEVERSRSELRSEKGSMKLFLKDGDWQRESDYTNFPALQIDHRISVYETQHGVSLKGYLDTLKCETLPFGDLSSAMDWECLVAERDKRKETLTS